MAPLVATAFSLSPSLGKGFCSPSLPTTLVKLSTLLGATKSNSPHYFHSGLLSLRIGCVVYVDVMFRVQILLQTQEEKVLPHLFHLMVEGWSADRAGEAVGADRGQDV